MNIPSNREVDVVVVGGGPTGLWLACELRSEHARKLCGDPRTGVAARLERMRAAPTL